MKFCDLNLKKNEVALIEIVAYQETITVAQINQDGGACSCCQAISHKDEIKVLKRMILEVDLNESK
jgi:hypothetical protein